MAKRKGGRARTPKGRSSRAYRDTLHDLQQKLRAVHLSGRMRALVDYVVGERYTTPWIGGMSITSDGFVIVRPEDETGPLHDEFLGGVGDLFRNYAGVLRTAEASPAEAALFCYLCDSRVFNATYTRLMHHFADMFSAEVPAPDPAAAKVRERIDKLRERTVARGCTAAEAATAARIADELEAKLTKPTKKKRTRAPRTRRS